MPKHRIDYMHTVLNTCIAEQLHDFLVNVGRYCVS